MYALALLPDWRACRESLTYLWSVSGLENSAFWLFSPPLLTSPLLLGFCSSLEEVLKVEKMFGPWAARQMATAPRKKNGAWPTHWLLLSEGVCKNGGGCAKFYNILGKPNTLSKHSVHSTVLELVLTFPSSLVGDIDQFWPSDCHSWERAVKSWGACSVSSRLLEQYPDSVAPSQKRMAQAHQAMSERRSALAG